MTDPVDIAPGFILLQGNRLESLRHILTGWLKTHPLNPLESETVLVQSNGMAQWLRLGLAQERQPLDGGLGIATALEMILPARLQWQCYRAILGQEAVPLDSPLDKNRLVWRLMRLLPELLDHPDFSALRYYLQAENQIDERRLYQLAQRIADQLDQYQVYRADWLHHWRQGHDELPTGEIPLDTEHRWQPILWRTLVQDLQDQLPDTAPESALASGRAGLHQAFRTTAAQLAHRPAHLPRRIIVFGLSTLPPQILDVLATVARWTQVIVCLQNPCRHYWGDLMDGHHFFRAPPRRTTADVSPSAQSARPEDIDPLDGPHPLLSAWGRQGRDLMRLLDEFDDSARFQADFTQNQLALDLFESPYDDGRVPSVLADLQDDVLELRSPRELLACQRTLDPAQDHSIRFHSAHSPLREVEILHDQLLAAFDADATLSPTDIIVMVPDMGLYAPAITAIFGRLDRDDPRYLPYAISDQTVRTRAPLIVTLELLLRLPQARIGRSEVLDLLGHPLLRARFGISDTDLPILHTWIDGAGIRWGLDAAHREHFGLPPDIEQNSWLFGLNRLLLGYLSGDTALTWQEIEPYAGIDSSSVSLLGGLADLIDRLTHYTQSLRQDRPAEAWGPILTALLDDFFIAAETGTTRPHQTPIEDTSAWQADLEWRTRLLTALEQWLMDCRAAAFSDPISIETVQSAWLAYLEPHRLQQRFLVGGINFATLMPMRTIPYRHIYLLGMDDANYPRRQPGSDFDLMAARYRPGDRSRREDDRYLFLEALLAARERLTISWVGRDIRKNTRRPASVLVNQLADYINQFWHIEGTEHPSDCLTTEHPLHPFSPRYFSTENPDLFTYASDWREIHDAAPSSRAPHPEALPIWQPGTALSLDALGRFLRHPGHTLWRERFNTRLPKQDDDAEDHEPFALSPLDEWQIKKHINDDLRRHLAHTPLPSTDTEETLTRWLQQQLRQRRLAGQLPLIYQEHAEALLEPLIQQWMDWYHLRQQYGHSLPPPSPQQIRGTQGIVLEDALRDLRHDDQGQRARIIFHAGRLHKGRTIDWHKIVPEWPAHLMAQLITPRSEQPTQTLLVSESGTLSLPPLAAADAQHRLVDLLDAWHESAQQPYPLACKTAFAWLSTEGDAEKRLNKAQQTFESSKHSVGERENDPFLARLWPDFQAFAATQTNQGQSFTDLAERIYTPLKTALENSSAPS